ncbi:hypothetical protein GCM10018793_70080 [Streptomyces sulfonofaciens]|uniref:Uncharacterized protein n=1 Tax=Streptomyces sulfonofaciens TaxID=68272 RepID=A0A919LAI7_9ACTN|nr:hypothetical protein [Streptomyces sulfonofaciens]GHH88854.1 hypothetical protein GCM10018793_70080 [Streptomyces sulfonofaciens]
MAAFVEDLRTGRFRAGLRVKRAQRAQGIYELTWSNGHRPRRTRHMGGPDGLDPSGSEGSEGR